MYKFKKYENGTIEIFGSFLKYYNDEDDVLECPFLEFTNCEMLDMDEESLFLEVDSDSKIVELDALGEVIQVIFDVK